MESEPSRRTSPRFDSRIAVRRNLRMTLSDGRTGTGSADLRSEGRGELRRWRTALAWASSTACGWLPAPQVLAVTCFLSGVVLLASGDTPAVSGRLGWLRRVPPLPGVAVSQFARRRARRREVLQ